MLFHCNCLYQNYIKIIIVLTLSSMNSLHICRKGEKCFVFNLLLLLLFFICFRDSRVYFKLTRHQQTSDWQNVVAVVVIVVVDNDDDAKYIVLSPPPTEWTYGCMLLVVDTNVYWLKEKKKWARKEERIERQRKEKWTAPLYIYLHLYIYEIWINTSYM